MKIKITAFWLLILSFSPIHGQDDAWPEWKNYLNTSKIKSIVVDNDTLWLATNGGMIKYNKNTKQKIFFNRGNSNIQDNFINEIAKDKDGNLWLGGHFYGISKFDKTTFTNYNDENSSIPSIQWCTSISFDTEGNKWFSSLNNVIKFDGNKFQTWKTGSPLSSSNIINDIFVDNDDNVWVAGEWGIAVIKSGILSYIGQVTSLISCIASDKNGDLWFGGKNNTLIKYSNNEFTRISLTTTTSNNYIYSMAFDKSNALWLGSTEGVIQYAESKEIIYNSNNSDLPKDDGMLSIAVDGNDIWIGTFLNGLYKLTNNTIIKIQLVLNEIPKIGNIKDLEFFNNSIYFVGINKNYLKLKDDWWSTINIPDDKSYHSGFSIKRNGGKLLVGGPRPSPFNYIVNDSVLFDSIFLDLDIVINSILPINETSYWLGTSKGLWKYEDNIVTEKYTTENSPLISDEVNDIIFDKEGNLWGAMSQSIFKFDSGNWIIYDSAYSDLFKFNITKIRVDSENSIWFNALDLKRIKGDYYGNGINKLTNGELTNYNIYNSELPSNTIFDILVTDTDVIWCGTCARGLAKFEDNKSWTIYNTYNSGIAHNDVSALEKTDDGNLWIGHWTRGCVSVLNTNPTSIEPQESGKNNTVTVYPNPTSNSFSIDFGNSNIGLAEVSLLDISGKVILNLFKSKTDEIINLNVQSLSTGIYIIQINSKTNGTFYLKAIISR